MSKSNEHKPLNFPKPDILFCRTSRETFFRKSSSCGVWGIRQWRSPCHTRRKLDLGVHELCCNAESVREEVLSKWCEKTLTETMFAVHPAFKSGPSTMKMEINCKIRCSLALVMDYQRYTKIKFQLIPCIASTRVYNQRPLILIQW